MSESTGIIVLGANGRMGQEICRRAEAEPEFHLAGAVDVKSALTELANLGCPVSEDPAELLAADSGSVLVDFTAPEVTLKAVAAAARFHAPMVIGTTGFTRGQLDVLSGFANETPLLWSSNMSVGVNVLRELLPVLARALGPAYDIEIAEIHHRKKKDAPSGTALMLADALAGARGWNRESLNSSRSGLTGARPDQEIGVMAFRGGDVVGIHTVYFLGPGEIIEVKHQAESRANFAQGALRAAAWLKGRSAGRLYSMRDVIGPEICGGEK